MRALIVTNMYPTVEKPAFGVFVHDQVESLRRLGIEVDVFFANGRQNKLNYLLAHPRFWNHLRKHRRYDVLHAHYVLSGLIARAQRRTPVVLTHHGPEVFTGWQGRLSRLVTPWFQRVIVVSQEMKERLGYPQAYIIPCGVDQHRFRPEPREEARQRLGLPQNKKLVLWAGEYWRPEKRFDLVQQSVALLQKEDASVELVVLSGKPHGDVPAYMNACDALLLVSDGEGSPMVVKEAMSCNVPVVATPVGDVPQVISGTEGCYLCSQDPEDIKEKLRLALEFPRRTNGREAVKRLSIQAIAEQIAGLYAGLAGGRYGRLTEVVIPASARGANDDS